MNGSAARVHRESLVAIAVIFCVSEVDRKSLWLRVGVAGGRWLMIEMRKRAVLEDVLKLVQVRVKPKN